jgi:hypothetical protein
MSTDLPDQPFVHGGYIVAGIGKAVASIERRGAIIVVQDVKIDAVGGVAPCPSLEPFDQCAAEPVPLRFGSKGDIDQAPRLRGPVEEDSSDRHCALRHDEMIRCGVSGVIMRVAQPDLIVEKVLRQRGRPAELGDFGGATDMVELVHETGVTLLGPANVDACAGQRRTQTRPVSPPVEACH